MPKTIKFSQFLAGGALANGDYPVGLNGPPGVGTNTIWNFNGSGGGSGAVTQVITQMNSFTPGQWVRFDIATDQYVTALATTPLNAEVVGVVIAVSPVGGPPFTQFTLQQSGYITSAQGIFGALSPGSPYYLSDIASGAMVDTDIIIDGEVSRPVFLPDSASSGWVLPYRGIIIGGGLDIGTSGPGTTTDSNIVTVVQNGHNLAIGTWVRITIPQSGPQVQYVPADATSLGNAQAVGVVIGVINANQFILQFAGYI